MQLKLQKRRETYIPPPLSDRNLVMEEAKKFISKNKINKDNAFQTQTLKKQLNFIEDKRRDIRGVKSSDLSLADLFIENLSSSKSGIFVYQKMGDLNEYIQGFERDKKLRELSVENTEKKKQIGDRIGLLKRNLSNF